MRRRAQALLGHCRSLSIDQLAALYTVGRNATTNGQTAYVPALAVAVGACSYVRCLGGDNNSA